jgi:hypothetical protein
MTIDLDLLFAQKDNTSQTVLTESSSVPEAVTARISLVDKFNYSQQEVNAMTTNEVLLEYRKQNQLYESKKSIDFDSVLREWSYRCDKGYPEVGNPSDMIHLQNIFEELGVESPFPKITTEAIPPAAKPKKKSLTAKQSPATIEGANTPELKEGLAIYFATQPAKILDMAAAKAADAKNTSVLTLNSDIDVSYYGTKSAVLVAKAIEYLNTNSITANNSRLYLNSISIARKIQDSFGQVKQESIDRGNLYTSIRKHAVNLVSEMGIAADEDKWCPADIYIYNDSVSANQALQSDTLNADKNSLNAMFGSEFNQKSGIVGISLKEEKAQAGKATSFRQILTREENYPDAMKLSDIQKSTLELLYNLNILKVNNAKNTPKIKVGYLAEALRIITTKKILGTENLVKFLVSSLKTTFKNDIKAAYGPRGGFNKDAARKSFEDLGLTELILDKRLITAIDSFSEFVKSDALTAYKSSRKAFVNTLTRLNFKVPAKSSDINKLDSETLYKKASCYLVAEYLLSGLNAEKLRIPKAYKTIIVQKNAFVAMTAYAVGMGGISPTFFKLVGSTSGTNAHLEPFYGDGFLNVGENSTTDIVDTNEYKGFYVTFVADVILGAGKSAKKKGAYSVTLDFRYAGDQLNIEVSDLKQVK